MPLMGTEAVFIMKKILADGLLRFYEEDFNPNPAFYNHSFEKFVFIPRKGIYRYWKKDPSVLGL